MHACTLLFTFLILTYRICRERNKEGKHRYHWHWRKPRSPLTEGHDRHGGDCSQSLYMINSDLCHPLLPAAHLSVRLSTGHIREAREWAEGNKHQPRGPKKELPGADRAQTHSASHPTVLWWGQLQKVVSCFGRLKEKWDFSSYLWLPVKIATGTHLSFAYLRMSMLINTHTQRDIYCCLIWQRVWAPMILYLITWPNLFTSLVKL